MWGHSESMAIHEQRSSPSPQCCTLVLTSLLPTHRSASPLIWEFSPSRAVRDKFVLYRNYKSVAFCYSCPNGPSLIYRQGNWNIVKTVHISRYSGGWGRHLTMCGYLEVRPLGAWTRGCLLCFRREGNCPSWDWPGFPSINPMPACPSTSPQAGTEQGSQSPWLLSEGWLWGALTGWTHTSWAKGAFWEFLAS
jgi:hypothetical protein